jgi:hypothetical protein
MGRAPELGAHGPYTRARTSISADPAPRSWSAHSASGAERCCPPTSTRPRTAGQLLFLDDAGGRASDRLPGATLWSRRRGRSAYELARSRSSTTPGNRRVRASGSCTRSGAWRAGSTTSSACRAMAPPERWRRREPRSSARASSSETCSQRAVSGQRSIWWSESSTSPTIIRAGVPSTNDTPSTHFRRCFPIRGCPSEFNERRYPQMVARLAERRTPRG